MIFIILGIIQGLTEFLPVSSSGHLVLAGSIFNVPEEQILPIIIFCHIGTLIAVFCYFAGEFSRVIREFNVVFQIFIVTAVTCIIGLLGRRFFVEIFRHPVYVCSALLITSVLLLLSDRYREGKRDMFALNIKDAFWLGLSQGIAIIPGISRSGITMFSLLARGVKREDAFKFSFIAGIPSIAGSFILEFKHIGSIWIHYPEKFCSALITSFLFGMFSLFILKRAVKNFKLHFLGYYLIVISLLGFIFLR